MYNDNILGKNRLKERIKEISILALFTIATAVISLILMDIIILPLTIFAISNVSLYTTLFKIVALFCIFFIPLYMIYIRVRELKKNGIKNKEVFKILLIKPVRFLAIFFFILFCTAVIVILLYILFDNNNYLMYRINN